MFLWWCLHFGGYFYRFIFEEEKYLSEQIKNMSDIF